MQKTLWLVALIVMSGCSMDDAAKVDRLFSDYRPEGTPGASVMVIKDGEPILTKS